MKTTLTTTVLLLAAALLLGGCSTLERFGIGGEPQVWCRKGQAVIDDRIAGPDQARLSVVRRLKDADVMCKAVASAIG